MEKVLFADTFTKTFKKTFKIPAVVIDDPIFRLHYKFTGLVLLFASILVSGYQFFGDPIMCIQRDDIPEQLLNTYCWIEGTFTLPKALTKKVGVEVVHAGVDKYIPGDEVVEHAYYQWVCFVLFFQALLFCAPYFLWKSLESGKMKNLIQKLQNPVIECKVRDECYLSVARFFQNEKNDHSHYALKFLICEALNFIVVIFQIYFIDVFLGGEFTRYGVEVVKYANMEQANRTDPMIRVFPRITKCTFHKYGSSGDVQRHDALCLLPLNILNEKIFIVMWFWLIILAILGGLTVVYRVVIMVSKQARYLLLNCVASLTTNKDVEALIKRFNYGDWFLLYLLGDNIDNFHFNQILQQLLVYNGSPSPRDIQYDKTLKMDDVDKGYGKKELPIYLEKEALIDKGESVV